MNNTNFVDNNSQSVKHSSNDLHNFFSITASKQLYELVNYDLSFSFYKFNNIQDGVIWLSFMKFCDLCYNVWTQSHKNHTRMDRWYNTKMSTSVHFTIGVLKILTM